MATIEDFRKVELLVAQIKEVKEHPNADRLYVLQVDTGRDVRQIVAGVRKTYTPEQLLNRRIILVANLDAAVIRGEASNGMLLAASDENTQALLMPDKEMPLGTTIK